jgi:hypothetical protein
MEGLVMRKLAEAVRSVGFVVKKIEEETYDSFNRPPNGEKYTGEIIIKIRPVEAEEDEQKQFQARKEKERNMNKPPASEEDPF